MRSYPEASPGVSTVHVYRRRSVTRDRIRSLFGGQRVALAIFVCASRSHGFLLTVTTVPESWAPSHWDTWGFLVQSQLITEIGRLLVP
jgi:hypothetical protein